MEYKPTVEKIISDLDGTSYYIADANGIEPSVWVDVYPRDGDIIPDFNMYIFDLTNSNDMRVKAFQESDNGIKCLEYAQDLYMGYI